MPPLLASLAAALLSPRRTAAPSDHTDLLSLDITSLQRLHSTTAATSAAPRASDPAAPAPRPADPPAAAQAPHPAAAMAVTYSLFLLGRGQQARDSPAAAAAVETESAPPRKRRLLPVRLDLHARGGVRAERAERAERTSAETDADDGSDAPHAPHSQHYSHLARASNLRDGPRHIAIVTTAAIPWMTGTSVNPALRAIYLAKDGHKVTLVIPWLASADEQRSLFSKGSPTFATRAEHAAFIHAWARSQVADVKFDILFYDGVYAAQFGSILPVGAITDAFARERVVTDVCILEEPEHLTWHHAGRVWTEIFNIVVGIIHTNYIEYARQYGLFGPQKALAMLFLNKWVCRGYCHRIIKLSDAVQTFPNSVTRNVHGVRDRFIRIGRARAAAVAADPAAAAFPRGAYFLGKVLWAKGYRDLIDHMEAHHDAGGAPLAIDFFGDGPDASAVAAEVACRPALSSVTFHARVADPTSEHIRGYKVFVNASRSDVVCTATAEALAMGKLVVCLEHASNEFFATFPNCITYRTPAEFAACVTRALDMEPRPLSEEDAHRLTWEAATERLYDATRLPLSRSRPSKVDLALGSAHATLSKIYPQPGKGIQRANTKEQKQGSVSSDE